MLHTIDAKYDDIEDKAIADLGCGCGILTIGSAILGSGSASCYCDIDDHDSLKINLRIKSQSLTPLIRYNVGFELDDSAIEDCTNNLEEFEVEADIIQCDIGLLFHFSLIPSCLSCQVI